MDNLLSNKRGQFFSLYLVLLTIAMIALDLAVYLQGQDKIQGAVVNPGEVLSVSHSYDLFMIREQEIILDSLYAVGEGHVFGTNEFSEEFRGLLISAVLEDPLMSEFILEDIALDGKKLDAVPDNLFESRVYSASSFVFDEDTLSFSRGSLGKEFTLTSDSLKKVSFPVRVYFEHSQDYRVTFDGFNYLLEVVE